ncbi:MAG: transcriptional regulator NrdR [Planctomycetota bacterium]
MRCPFCGADDDKVIDSRAADGGRAIRRRRQCNNCHKRFTTREAVDDTIRLTVIKKDGSRVPYERAKVSASVEAACYKRAVPAEAILALRDRVEDELFKTGKREIESLEIGRRVMDHLRHLDGVAYVRFASIYLRFNDIDDFINEAQELREALPESPSPDQQALFDGEASGEAGGARAAGDGSRAG